MAATLLRWLEHLAKRIQVVRNWVHLCDGMFCFIGENYQWLKLNQSMGNLRVPFFYLIYTCVICVVHFGMKYELCVE